MSTTTTEETENVETEETEETEHVETEEIDVVEDDDISAAVLPKGWQEIHLVRKGNKIIDMVKNKEIEKTTGKTVIDLV